MEKRNKEKSKTLLQEKPVILFILFSVFPLLLSARFGSSDIFLFGIVLLLITMVLFRDIFLSREVRIFCSLLVLYGFWVVTSFLLHYKGLSDLDPMTYISITKDSAYWGIGILKDTTVAYLLFPILFFFSLSLIRNEEKEDRMMRMLPILIIPSLLVALYQGIIDITFLNHPYFIQLNRVSGLDHDSNAFGISLFLLIPLCILSFILIKDSLKRILLTVLIIYVFWGLLLSGSLTGFTGIIIFLFILPWIVVWAERSLPSGKRKILIAIPFVFFLLFTILALIPLKKDIPFASVLLNRLDTTYADYKNGGMGNVLEKSGRMNLGYNAIQLTRLSPLSGWGPGGFLRNLQNVRFRRGDTGSYFLMDNANNQYLQMSSELGFLGGSLNTLLYILPLWMIFRVRKKLHDRVDRISIGIVFSTVCIMMLLFITGPHTVVISVLWILVVLLSYLFVIALKYGYSFGKGAKSISGVLVIATLLFCIGTYDNVFGREGYITRQSAEWWSLKYEKNCYLSEHFEKWRVLRWCKKGSSLQIPLHPDFNKDSVTLQFALFHPDIETDPVTLRYGGKSGPVHEMIVDDNIMKEIEIPVSDEYLYTYRGAVDWQTQKYLVLTLDVSRTWIPKEMNVSDDTRELGVGVIYSVK